MPVEEYCLGVEALGRCAAMAQPLVSIGEALAVAALVFAFWRLAGPLAHMRWRTRRISEPIVVWCVLAAIVFVFIAAGLRFFGEPWTRVPVIGFPMFWEMLGGLTLA